ncbi:MAG: hypothetical protein GY793_04460 [Proteobacteria bacterium]|nr:hypothetical protein [Pseudomonadota bacterium]
MKKLLLIRRIQTDFEWEDDCHNIAVNIVKELDYKFPYIEYRKLLEEGFGKYIADREIYYSEPLNLNELFEEVFRQGFNYALKYENTPNYFEFKLTMGDLSKINTLIKKHTKRYYQTIKKELLKKLDDLDKDTIIIYPRKFYIYILKAFYEHSYITFYSSFNNDDECINEYLQELSITDYRIVHI